MSVCNKPSHIYCNTNTHTPIHILTVPAYRSPVDSSTHEPATNVNTSSPALGEDNNEASGASGGASGGSSGGASDDGASDGGASDDDDDGDVTSNVQPDESPLDTLSLMVNMSTTTTTTVAESGDDSRSLGSAIPTDSLDFTAGSVGGGLAGSGDDLCADQLPSSLPGVELVHSREGGEEQEEEEEDQLILESENSDTHTGPSNAPSNTPNNDNNNKDNKDDDNEDDNLYMTGYLGMESFAGRVQTTPKVEVCMAPHTLDYLLSHTLV